MRSGAVARSRREADAARRRKSDEAATRAARETRARAAELVARERADRERELYRVERELSQMAAEERLALQRDELSEAARVAVTRRARLRRAVLACAGRWALAPLLLAWPVRLAAFILKICRCTRPFFYEDAVVEALIAATARGGSGDELHRAAPELRLRAHEVAAARRACEQHDARRAAIALALRLVAERRDDPGLRRRATETLAQAAETLRSSRQGALTQTLVRCGALVDDGPGGNLSFSHTYNTGHAAPVLLRVFSRRFWMRARDSVLSLALSLSRDSRKHNASRGSLRNGDQTVSRFIRPKNSTRCRRDEKIYGICIFFRFSRTEPRLRQMLEDALRAAAAFLLLRSAHFPRSSDEGPA